ncbi:hypothetical protein AMJ40_04725 [candidate division TA06 bacterium DG_26]|uniref:Cell division protein FtsL n=1 Tax=candidate division TA06 bacterium DG_26 TaxID=1703771 RepID=A0A0S7WI41_UNCT6|nr:MAG: hypothetical protein AMJ40_04725 [candidate division TA06 bacterium DG_26]
MVKVLRIALPVLFLFFLLVWERAHLVKINLRIEECKRRRADLETQVHSLEVRVQDLASYARIENVARVRLGMRYPDSEDVIYIRKDRTE